MAETETQYETYETVDIPADRLTAVVAGYMVDHPIRIEQIKQANGKWTVRATFPK
jgi:hypothetical protein